MEHIYQAGQSNYAWTFVTLHGTGGNEQDLLSVAEYLNPAANILSFRGDVNEQGYLRFFKRKAEGVYDWDDLTQRRQRFVEHIVELSQTYGFDLDKVIFVGFSNGSNMAMDILLHATEIFKYGILFAPLYPKALADSIELNQTQLFLSMGQHDPICPMSENQYLLDQLQDKGAKIQTTWVGGHQITQASLDQAKEWIKAI